MPNYCFLGSDTPIAQESVQRLSARFGHVPAGDADVIVALGGDGFMLQTLHGHMHLDAPVYGMNRGSVGFLMNDYVEDELEDCLAAAKSVRINPLRMEATGADGAQHDALAINEVALFRETYQAAKIRIRVDDQVRMSELVCDGVLVATPAGSTAYNLSAQGPILPIHSRLMALTPISPFRPRRWRGAILPWETQLVFDILEADKRPIAATADHRKCATWPGSLSRSLRISRSSFYIIRVTGWRSGCSWNSSRFREHAMSVREQLMYWGLGLLVFILMLWLLADALLPFALGATLAYLTDPIAAWLERCGVGRVTATVLITLISLAGVVIVLLLVIPLLVEQIRDMVQRAPGFVDDARTMLAAWLPGIEEEGSFLNRAVATVRSNAEAWSVTLLKQVWSGGLAFINFVAVVVVTPVVASIF